MSWLTPSQQAMWPMIERIQRQLSPEQSRLVVAINRHTGEYVLGNDYGDAFRAYRERFAEPWPFIVHVDGSPALRM